jgi:hypothetical protein
MHGFFFNVYSKIKIRFLPLSQAKTKEKKTHIIQRRHTNANNGHYAYTIRKHMYVQYSHTYFLIHGRDIFMEHVEKSESEKKHNQINTYSM